MEFTEPQFEGGSAYYMDGNGKPVDAMDEICFDTAKVLDAYASTLADRTDNKKGGLHTKDFTQNTTTMIKKIWQKENLS
ncbi:MAG: hypothetical protein SPI86_04725 [Treponemataceae bacterium]|nr:hypothetical protein [Treponemataceae bacterium]